ncbi:hypothetical protein ACIRD3_04510 [Kitasatospora sp. NPDC093550]|uniref:hypothetical protein n=1 Tax=Kitasatospora sp. NPDC093550 TaxID=3364089 RepID=UPI0037FCE490
MTNETDSPVYTQATRAPWREILRHRWSGRRDRVLVLRDRDGHHHQLGARRRSVPEGQGGGSGARVGLRGFDRAYLVELDERSNVGAVGLPTPYGTEPLEVDVLWWVHDAAQVVRTGTSRGWRPVRKDLDRRLHQLKEQFAAAGAQLGAHELAQYLAAPCVLSECGLSYRVTDVSAREHGTEPRLGEPHAANLWIDTSPAEYEFCRRSVQDGPVALAALWLARKPDEVREVLDWAVGHADLLRGETTWQDQLAGMLGTLTAQEQQELSRMLRDRLVALGRKVPGPGPQAPGPEFVKIRSQANGWTPGAVPNGSPR